MKSSWRLLLLLCVLCYVVSVNIKIVDPPHTNRYYNSASTTKILTLRAPPANISGPPHLQLLYGECFQLKDRSYTYLFCPFHNVTQQEDSSVWNHFHGVLGVWREWLIKDGEFVGMHYTLGEPCGSTDREVKIMFNCSTVTMLNNVTEPSTCKYTIWFHTPLACFKGAMQIYHVLGKERLHEWDAAILDYQNGELTKKGLVKRHREVLLGAGLYYNFTKDQEYFKHQEQQSTSTARFTSDTGSRTSWSSSTTQAQSDLDQCNKRVKSFENQLLRAKEQIDTVLSMVGAKDSSLKEEIVAYLSAANSTHTSIITANSTNNQTAINNPKITEVLDSNRSNNVTNRTTVQSDSNRDNANLEHNINHL